MVPQPGSLSTLSSTHGRSQCNMLYWIDQKVPSGFSITFLCVCFFFFSLFLAVLGLHCCAQAFSCCSKWGLLFVVVHGLFIAVASLVEHRL